MKKLNGPIASASKVRHDFFHDGGIAINPLLDNLKYLRVQTMIAIVFALLLQAPDQQAAATPVADPEKPRIVCTMEPITGTRAKKQEVCKTPGYEKGSERSRDMLAAIQRASNIQPGEPPAQGVRPGGPGF
jgi:hypothetical protein